MKRAWIAAMVGVAVSLAGSPGLLSAQDSSADNAPDTVRFDRARLGVVTFAHSAHEDRAECETCHHESKPEMALEVRYQPCGDCHTDEVAAPMETGRDVIFHVNRAESGICVDCHKEEEANGAEVPKVCKDCHVRESGQDADELPVLVEAFLKRR